MSFDEESNLNTVRAFLPKEREFVTRKLSEGYYELTNGKCKLKFSFDRFDPSKVVTLILDPLMPNDTGMKLLILRHLLSKGVQPRMNEERFQFIGRVLATNMSSLLLGDFSIRQKYDAIEEEFLNRIDDVMSLPKDSPARELFDKCDIGWLKLMAT